MTASSPDDGLLAERVRVALEELAAEHPVPWKDAAGPGEKVNSSSEGEQDAA